MAWVSLNRPEVRNAINQKMQDELARAVDGVPLRRRGPLRRPHRRGPLVLHRHRPGRGRLRGEHRLDGGRGLPRLPDPVDVRRPGSGRRAQEPGPLEAGDRRRAGHGLRRRLLHARPDRVHHRQRRRHLLRPPRHLRDDRGLRAHRDALQDAVAGGHAHVAARRPRADVRRAGPGDRPGQRGRAPRRAAASGPPGPPGSSPTRRRWSSRGRCGRCGPPTRCPAPRASAMANLFTRIGSDAAAFKAGQDRFASGQRVEWRSCAELDEAGGSWKKYRRASSSACGRWRPRSPTLRPTPTSRWTVASGW